MKHNICGLTRHTSWILIFKFMHFNLVTGNRVNLSHAFRDDVCAVPMHFIETRFSANEKRRWAREMMKQRHDWISWWNEIIQSSTLNQISIRIRFSSAFRSNDARKAEIIDKECNGQTQWFDYIRAGTAINHPLYQILGNNFLTLKHLHHI